jgi:acyl carrier protein
MSEKAKIREFIFENYMFGESEDALDNDDSFLEKGIIDSTGILELVMFAEDTYDMEVEDDEVIPDNFDSINKLCAYISKKTAGQCLILTK